MDFFDAEGIESAEEVYDDLEAETHDMTEEEAFDTYRLASALGLGEEIGLEEADLMRSIELTDDLTKAKGKDPISIKEARGKVFHVGNTSNISSVTGKPKCPFEQWIKDVCAGRKTVHDPVGGENSYGELDAD